jgi:hypothetical protein
MDIKNQQVIDLRNYINDNVNVVEISFCKKNELLFDNKQLQIINNIADDNDVKIIETKFKNSREEKFKSYYMKDKIYTYDLENDNQQVSSKCKINSNLIRRDKKYDLFIVSYNKDRFPPYLFPCTDEIDHICSYTIKEFKINNRISLIIRKEDNMNSIYIEYKHSQNVDIDKMNDNINRLVKYL